MAATFMLREFTVLAVVAVALSLKTTEEWKTSFDRSDTNGDQRVSQDEFRETMQDMGWALSLEQQAEAFAAYDIDEPNDGFSFGEFKQMWNHTLAYSGDDSPNVPTDVQFAQVDRNGDGVFVMEEMVAGVYIAGKELSDEQLQQRFDTFDKYPKDGKINLCELYAGFNGVDWS